MDKVFFPEGQHDRIVIMAPGPSLSKEQVKLVINQLKNFFIITIGDAYLKYPFADILYHCDARWWNHYKGVEEFYGCQRVSLEPVRDPNIKHLFRSTLRNGLEKIPPYVVTGGNSGYQAINLAYHYKPKEIILLGYDMKKAPNGQYSVRGQHPKELHGSGSFLKFITTMNSIAQDLVKEGIKVYNCSPDSALDCFEKKELKDVL